MAVLMKSVLVFLSIISKTMRLIVARLIGLLLSLISAWLKRLRYKHSLFTWIAVGQALPAGLFAAEAAPSDKIGGLTHGSSSSTFRQKEKKTYSSENPGALLNQQKSSLRSKHQLSFFEMIWISLNSSSLC